MVIKTGNDLLKICNKQKIHLFEAITLYEKNISGKTEIEILEKMKKNLTVMRDAIYKGLNSDDEELKGKIIKRDAKKLKERYETKKTVCGEIMAKAVSYALASMEINASMGKIVAAPTAGSCGILPAVLFSIEESHGILEEQLINGLLTASAVGIVIAKNASLSGAEGGCQAEVGSAAAMAAAAVVEMLGGTPSEALNGAAIALKNLLGLVCDPIAGLVEAPCAKRNAIGTANALVAAEMALAGIESVIPFDEVVDAMHKIGKMLPCTLRETAEGGLAATPTGRRIANEILEQGYYSN